MKSNRQTVSTWMSVGLLGAVLVVALGQTSSEKEIWIDAMTRAEHDLELAFTVPGEVAEVLVKPGERVKAGQLLMRLKDDETRFEAERLKVLADSETSIEEAKARFELSKINLDRLIELESQGGAKKIEVDTAKAQNKIDELGIKAAEERVKQNRFNADIAKSSNERNYLYAPIDGVIEEVVVEKGETVDKLRPVVRLVSTEKLWIDAGLVPTDLTIRLDLGKDDPAWMRFKLPDGKEEIVEGKILYVRQVAMAAADTCPVRVEVPNSHNRPAGTRVKVCFTKPADLAMAMTDAQ